MHLLPLVMTSLLLLSGRRLTSGFLLRRPAATRTASVALCSTASTGLRVKSPEAMELLGSAFAVDTQPGDVICLTGYVTLTKVYVLATPSQ